MEISETDQLKQTTQAEGIRAHSRARQPALGRLKLSVYALAAAISISLWFLAIRAPLDLDETGSYWPISAGFSRIWPRGILSLSFPAYSYILWLWTKLFGNSEIALRILSVLAMLGAAYLLYRSAREMFDRDITLFAALIFCLHPAIVFASIDVRPYAFGALATTAAIFILIRLRHDNSSWLAALFGFSAACIVWFQYLFAVILPVLALCFFVVKVGNRRTAWRQFGVAFAVFTLALLPTLPGFLYLFRTSTTHIYDRPPGPYALIEMLAPGCLLPIFCFLAPVSMLISAFSARRRGSKHHADRWKILLCVSLGVVPIAILFGVSLGTSIHLFEPRHCLVSVPGIALCWALILSRFRSHAVRMLFCIALVILFGWSYITSATSDRHNVPWKDALETVERDASIDNAPVLICSGFTESNYAVMPLESPKTSPLFAPLSYYPVSVPVVPLSLELNSETVRVASLFLLQAEQKHERFLVLGHSESHNTLEWIRQRASTAYTVSELRRPYGFEILEFLPRNSQRLGR